MLSYPCLGVQATKAPLRHLARQQVKNSLHSALGHLLLFENDGWQRFLCNARRPHRGHSIRGNGMWIRDEGGLALRWCSPVARVMILGIVKSAAFRQSGRAKRSSRVHREGNKG